MAFSSRIQPLCLAASLALTAVTFGDDARAAGVAPPAASAAQREQAQSRFLRGKELYATGRFDAALAEFTASLDIVASPNTRLYVARCLREMGRPAAAYAELQRTESDAGKLARQDPRYARTGLAAADERKALEAKVALVDITVTRPAKTTTMRVAGEDVHRAEWGQPVPVAPGTSEVVVETPGHQPITRTVELSEGQRQSLSIDADADAGDAAGGGAVADSAVRAGDAPPERGSLRPYAIVAGGVAAAGLATFTVFGLLANGIHSDLEAECGPAPCPPGHEDEISAGRTQQTIANVGLAVAIVGAATAVTLFVLDKPKASAPSTGARMRVVARGTFLGLGGTF